MQGLNLAAIGRFALDLVYPPKCVFCGAGGVFLCEACIGGLPRAGGSRCNRCWLPLRGAECVACAEHPTSVSRLRSVFRYEGDVRRVVHAFKFGGQSSLAPGLSQLLADAFFEHGLVADAIVGIPLTPARKRTRGYNQALLMANGLSAITGIPIVEALRRTGHARTQAGSATAGERRSNVQGVFTQAKPREQNIIGARVLLIDDVATTGATLNACAEALLAAGALSVSALTLARED
jgi:ComF family protein